MEKRVTFQRVLLINPPTGLYIREDRCQWPVDGLSATSIRPPLDLAYAAAVLRSRGKECTIRDYPVEGGGWDALREDIKSLEPHMLLVSATSPTINQDLKAAAVLKEMLPASFAVAKGAHFFIHDYGSLEKFSDLDAVIRGEVEPVMDKMAEGVPWSRIAGLTYRSSGKIHRNPEQSYLSDLDAIPFPARDLLRNGLYTRPDTAAPQTTLQTNRGCPSDCVYCLAGRASGKKIRSRSPENIAEEIEICLKEFGIRNFFFRADTFTWNKSWTIDVCREIIDRKLDVAWVCNSRVDTIDAERLSWMKRAGCWLISFGVESGNQEVLDRMKKGTRVADAKRALKLCREAGIKSYAFFVIGLPWENRETLLETARYSRQLDADFAEFSFAVPFPGSELYDIAIREKLMEENALDFFNNEEPVIRTFYLEKDELVALRKTALRGFYFRPRYILRTLGKLRSPGEAYRYVRFGLEKARGMLLK